MDVAYDEVVVPPSSRVPRASKIVNVIATLHPRNGGDSTRVLIVSGHYDSRASNPLDSAGNAPGADDDASGTAVVLELARVLSPRDFRATIKFVAFAGEEQGLLGSTALALRARREQWNIIGVFNNDIVGSANNAPKSLVRLFSAAFTPLDTGDVFRRRNALGLENDGASRSLARYVKLVSGTYVSTLGVELIYRLDRFLRGGDHSSFHELGFPAVRFTEAKENFAHQHQDVRTSNDTTYGDLLKFVDPAYCANVARVNAASLASLSFAPAAPANVTVRTRNLEDGTTLRWLHNKEPYVAGYRVWHRGTSRAEWDEFSATSDTTLTIPLSKDDYIFGVQAVDSAGNGSSILVPLPGKE